MVSHIPLESRTGRLPDFEVTYEFMPNDMGGARQNLFQGIRSGFLHEGDDPRIESVDAIHPELFDAAGAVITDESAQIAAKGRANMWIMSFELRDSVHRARMEIGTMGYLVIGATRIARVEVREIVGLSSTATSTTEKG